MADDDRTDDDHPLQRAHRFFRQAAPAIREVGDAIVQRVDEVVANATAIEGVVVAPEYEDAGAAGEESSPAAPIDLAEQRRGRAPLRITWVSVAVVAAAATYGALRLQRRDDAAA
jgi:hypothetical protein